MLLKFLKKIQPLVEKSFSRSIKRLYTDNGGEYIALKSHLASAGITHLTTPPHTPEHNDFSERRHRHIVETGLSLLHHASMPISFWPEAFATVVYLISRMPKVNLSNQTSYSKLFGSKPNYDKLRVFGCLCYPWLKPYTNHKLDAKSTPCMFVGYSLSQSAYMCLDPMSNKIYTSRHVKFVESVFRFLKKSTSTSAATSSPCPVSSSTATIPVPVHTPLPAALVKCVALVVPSPTRPPPATSLTPSTTSVVTGSHSQDPPSEPSSQIVPSNSHHMTTRSKASVFKPISRVSMTAQSSHIEPSVTAQSSPIEPTCISVAMRDPRWRAATSAQFDAIIRNGTWKLIPPSPDQNVIGCKWVFCIKRKPDGSIDRYKARLVAKGFHQRPRHDFHETFSPVFKPTTIRVILSLAFARGWPIKQFDVNDAFLHGRLTDDVFMVQPLGFVDPQHPTYVCHLQKSLYGLKQAPRVWNMALSTFLTSIGFVQSQSDHSLFILNRDGCLAYLLVYVDDLILTGSTVHVVNDIVKQLAAKFSIKDLGELSYFLGVEVLHSPDGMLLSQRKYMQDLLDRTHMSKTKVAKSPMATSPVLSAFFGTALSDASEYRSVVGSLQYLSLTRPDIAFVVNRLCEFMQRPTSDHWIAVKRVLRYLRGTLDLGLFLRRCSSFQVHAFSNAGWTGNPDNRSSVSANIVFLGPNAVSWSSKKQLTIARSSTEAEYRSIASTAAELVWIQSLLQELGIKLPPSPPIYCDNIGATYLCHNLVFHSRMKHIALDFHFVRQKIQQGELRVSHVTSVDQLADALTKPLSAPRLLQLRCKIGVLPISIFLEGSC